MLEEAKAGNPTATAKKYGISRAYLYQLLAADKKQSARIDKVCQEIKTRYTEEEEGLKKITFLEKEVTSLQNQLSQRDKFIGNMVMKFFSMLEKTSDEVAKA